MPAPILDLSSQALSVQNALDDIDLRNSILVDLIDGKSMLAIAQEHGLREKEIQSILNEALAAQTEFMKQNADTLQQMFFLQHQEMYAIAKAAALNPDRKGKDVFWFREMRTSLQAMENILNKYTKKGDEGPRTLNITVLPNTPLADLAQRLLSEGLADETIQQGS